MLLRTQNDVYDSITISDFYNNISLVFYLYTEYTQCSTDSYLNTKI